MLSALSIRNVVLIEKLDLDFQRGLCVFTGETGAGKSILLDSLSLALGMRADSSLVRYGCDKLTVTAVFQVNPGHRVFCLLSEAGLDEPEESELILKRTVSCDGKSKAFINDQPVSVALLKNVGDALVEIHGQFASHHLLNPATHLGVLDAYGHLNETVDICRQSYQDWQQKQRDLNIATEQLQQAEQEENFLRDSISDLKSLNPLVGEEEELIQKRTALMNSEKIITCLNNAYQLIGQEGQGAASLSAQTMKYLDKANALSDNAFADLYATVEQAQTALSEAVSELESATQSWGDTSQLPLIDDRLFALKDMARKHHVSVSQLPELLQELESKLSLLDHGRDDIAVRQKQAEQARLAYITAAQKLSAERMRVAKQLDERVMQELPALKLGKAQFLTDIQEVPPHEWHENGIDKVVFMVSTNAGLPCAPIHKVASGGELARFMLALKVNLASSDDLTTLVFDEVDTGIGGATADAVGERLKRLSETTQVLVVTHSPQVASYGQHHYVVGKSEGNGTVLTSVRFVDGIERLNEVARMLSGAQITESSRQMAQELLEKA